MKQTKRIEWVDTVKFICISFVILSHLETNTPFLSAFYRPFFLTSFFFASGYVYKSGRKFSEFITKKVKQLFIPWLVFSTVNLVLSSVISFNSHKSLVTELAWNFLQIRGKGDGVWFVACLFVAFIPFYFFIEWYENKRGGGTKLLIVTTFILSLISRIYTYVMPSNILPWESNTLPWHLEYIFQAMFYMVLGYVFKRKLEIKCNELCNRKSVVFLFAMYLLLVYLPHCFAIQMPEAISIVYLYLCEIIGVAVIVGLSKEIKSKWFVRYIGQNTLICFALHGKVYSLIQVILKLLTPSLYTTILNHIVLSSIFAIALTVIVMIVLLLPIYVINKWFPFIIGRQNANKNLNT